MSSLPKRLMELLQQPIEALGYEYVGLQLLANRRPAILRIYIDKPQGVSVEDCATVSRQVSCLLDIQEPLTGSYQLEISSPGLERPLFTLEHYQRFKGSKVVILLQIPLQECRQFRGVLQEVDDQGILLQGEKGSQRIEFSNIREAHLVPTI
ncbi:MAG: ribosome maturation factor RimP [Candidatus Symbiodolus clandestinus]